jgi:hypothetical protein
LTRNDLINASVHWNKNISYISSAVIRHNGNGSFANWSIPSPYTGNWTNYTLNLSNPTEFSTPGLINVSYIWANDTFGLENYTSPSHYFYLWGSSKVSNITLNDSVIYNESAVQVSCKVEDNSTNSGISNYNISFYEDDRFLNTVSTNTSGWANYSYTVNASTIPTNLNLKCNITDSTNLFYNASSENSKNTSLNVVELGIQASASSSSLQYGNNVEITANITGNASSIATIQANISFINLTNGVYVQAFEIKNLTLNQSFSSTEFKFNLTYLQPRPSNYSVNITVTAGKEKWNTTNFTVWGYSKLQEIRVNASNIYNGSSIQIECSVKDYNTDKSIPSYNVSFYKNDTSIGSDTTNTTGWANKSYTFNEATLPSNYTLKCNITNSTDLFYNASSAKSNSTTLRIVNPNEVQVGNFWFNYSGITTNKTNFNTNLTIYANVTDALQMSVVLANISYPNNVINVNISMSGDNSAGWHLWNYTFNTTYPLNTPGNYTVRIIARNSNGVENVSTNFLTFYVNNTYTLNLTTNYTTYNRGENITVQVWDVNDFPIQTLNWTVNITRYNQTETTNLLNNVSYTYRPNTTDPVGNYTLFVNVSKQGNTGNRTWQFDINITLNLNFTQPAENTEYGTNGPISGLANLPKVQVFNVRNESLNYTVNVTLHCPNGYFNLSLSSQKYFNDYADCIASTDAGVTFQITANASDVYNNSGNVSLNLRTQSSGGTIITGGGGGGGGGGNVTIIQNITVNATVKTTDFNFTAQTTGIQVYRGEDATIVGAVANTGNTNLTVSSSIFLNSTCCIVSIVPSEFKLNVGGAEVPFTISIHVNTSTEPEKEYFFDINLKSGTLEKTKRIKIIVKENPVISSLQQVSGQVSGIENELKEYARVGLNIGDLEGLLNKIKEMLSGSQSQINKDDINTLKSNEKSVKLSLAQINDQLNKLAFVKTIYENKWNIVSGITIGIISTYLIVLVFVPYFRLGLEITKLNFEKTSLVKSRVETEKNYFLRKIDEKTFRTIISGKQSQIYKITSDIKLKEQARPQLFRERINPMYLGKLIKEKIAKIRSKNKHVTPPPQQTS